MVDRVLVFTDEIFKIVIAHWTTRATCEAGKFSTTRVMLHVQGSDLEVGMERVIDGRDTHT